MKITSTILWVGFLAILILFRYYETVFAGAGVPGIVFLEFADTEKGKTILHAWDNAGLLRLGCRAIWIDFAFIIFYVGIIITLSNRQIRREPSIALNALLRANFFFAVLTGL